MRSCRQSEYGAGERGGGRWAGRGQVGPGRHPLGSHRVSWEPGGLYAPCLAG